MEAQGFVDPTQLTNLVKKSLSAFWMLSAFLLACDLIYYLLYKQSPLQITSIWYGVAGFFNILIFLTTVIFVSMWIYRANYNARQLGAVDMKFSPGWSVGWFFVPFANLSKCREILNELWKASLNPAGWQNEKDSILTLQCSIFLVFSFS